MSDKLVTFLMCSRGRHENFKQTIDSIVNGCLGKDKAEIFVKVDDDTNDLKTKEEILKNSGSDYRIISSPRGRGYLDMCLHYNEMAKLSTGLFLWVMTDRFTLVDNVDYCHKILLTRNVYKDNIYNIHITNEAANVVCRTPSIKHPSNFPLITREWYNITKTISEVPPDDRVITITANLLNRNLCIFDQPIVIATLFKDELKSENQIIWDSHLKPKHSREQSFNHAVQLFELLRPHLL